MGQDSENIHFADSQLLVESLQSAAQAVLKNSVKTISSEILLADAREVIIRHASEQYLLRLTNQGKLILTK